MDDICVAGGLGPAAELPKYEIAHGPVPWLVPNRSKDVFEIVIFVSALRAVMAENNRDVVPPPDRGSVSSSGIIDPPSASKAAAPLVLNVRSAEKPQPLASGNEQVAMI